MSNSDPPEGSRGRRVGFFGFAWRFGLFVIRHLVPRYGPRVAPLLLLSGICLVISVERFQSDWGVLPPLAVLVFGGIGLFTFRRTRHDELELKLLRDLAEGRTDSMQALGAVHGTIQALERPLVAPLSGIECVAFRYDIGIEGGGSDGADPEPNYQGYHLARTEIVSREGRFRLLAFPDLHEFEREDASRARAVRYVRKLSPTPAVPLVDSWRAADHARRLPHDELAVDLCFQEVSDWKEVTVDEWALPEGTKACVFGRVDREAKTLTPWFREAGRAVSVRPGRPETLLRTLSDEAGVGAGCAVLFLALGLTAFLIPISPVVAAVVGAISLLGLRAPRAVVRSFPRSLV